jgi:hypothetical protein
MYTLRMSWSFRTLVLSVAMVWALAPQIACFMPDEMTEAERECCKQMAHDCGNAGMSHECCKTVVRPDVGALAKAVRDIAPDATVLDRTIDSLSLVELPRVFSAPSYHAPPHDFGASPLVLRI